MNAVLARHRIENGWPELIPASFPRAELIRLMSEDAAAQVAYGDEAARTEGYEEAENEYKPDADKLASVEAERDAAVDRADKLQSDLDASLEGDTSALWAAKLAALRSEVLAAVKDAHVTIGRERKTDVRHSIMGRLHMAINGAFSAATPEPKKNAA